MSQSNRMPRVNELLQREIAGILEKLLFRESGSLVSVAEVKTSPDLRTAKVYISIMGSDESKKSIMKLIIKQRAFIQKSIASVVKIKYTPVLEFTLDNRFESGDKILSIIGNMEESGTSEKHE